MKDRLREIRKSMTPKLSQERFGELLGITRTAYHHIRNGSRHTIRHVHSTALHEIQYRRALAAHGRGRDV